MSKASQHGNPLELALQCLALSKKGLEPLQIAGKLDLSKNYVTQLLMLATATEDVIEMVRSGQVAAGVAIEAVRANGSEAGAVLRDALELASRAGKGKLTRKFLPDQRRHKALQRAASDMFAALVKVSRDSGFASLSPEVRAQIESLLASLQASGSLNRSGRRQ